MGSVVGEGEGFGFALRFVVGECEECVPGSVVEEGEECVPGSILGEGGGCVPGSLVGEGEVCTPGSAVGLGLGGAVSVCGEVVVLSVVSFWCVRFGGVVAVGGGGVGEFMWDL